MDLLLVLTKEDEKDTYNNLFWTARNTELNTKRNQGIRCRSHKSETLVGFLPGAGCHKTNENPAPEPVRACSGACEDVLCIKGLSLSTQTCLPPRVCGVSVLSGGAMGGSLTVNSGRRTNWCQLYKIWFPDTVGEKDLKCSTNWVWKVIQRKTLQLNNVGSFITFVLLFL